MPFAFSHQLSRYNRGFSSWDNGWTTEELQRIVDYCESLPEQEGQVGSGTQGEALHQTRDSTIAWVTENEACRWIFERLSAQVLQLNNDEYGFALSGFQDPQYTVYRGIKGRRGQHYSWHSDDMGAAYAPPAQAGQRVLTAKWRGECRKLSVVLQLSDPLEYEGGDLQVVGPYDWIVPKKQGLLAAFPSWTRHRVTPVTKGIRRTLVVWVYGPEFI